MRRRRSRTIASCFLAYGTGLRIIDPRVRPGLNGTCDSGGRAMPETIQMTVNGRRESVAVEGDTPLLYVLRNDLGVLGPKFGCGLAQCGACTVHLDGTAIRSCATPATSAKGASVTTLEGLAGKRGVLHA